MRSSCNSSGIVLQHGLQGKGYLEDAEDIWRRKEACLTFMINDRDSRLLEDEKLHGRRSRAPEAAYTCQCRQLPRSVATQEGRGNLSEVLVCIARLVALQMAQHITAAVDDWLI